MIRTDNGPAICVFDVDPPLLPDEVEIDIPSSPPERVTARMSAVALFDLVERTRS